MQTAETTIQMLQSKCKTFNIESTRVSNLKSGDSGIGKSSSSTLSNLSEIASRYSVEIPETDQPKKQMTNSSSGKPQLTKHGSAELSNCLPIVDGKLPNSKLVRKSSTGLKQSDDTARKTSARPTIHVVRASSDYIDVPDEVFSDKENINVSENLSGQNDVPPTSLQHSGCQSSSAEHHSVNENKERRLSQSKTISVKPVISDSENKDLPTTKSEKINTVPKTLPKQVPTQNGNKNPPPIPTNPPRVASKPNIGSNIKQTSTKASVPSVTTSQLTSSSHSNNSPVKTVTSNYSSKVNPLIKPQSGVSTSSVPSQTSKTNIQSDSSMSGQSSKVNNTQNINPQQQRSTTNHQRVQSRNEKISTQHQKSTNQLQKPTYQPQKSPLPQRKTPVPQKSPLPQRKTPISQKSTTNISQKTPTNKSSTTTPQELKSSPTKSHSQVTYSVTAKPPTQTKMNERKKSLCETPSSPKPENKGKTNVKADVVTKTTKSNNTGVQQAVPINEKQHKHAIIASSRSSSTSSLPVKSSNQEQKTDSSLKLKSASCSSQPDSDIINKKTSGGSVFKPAPQMKVPPPPPPKPKPVIKPTSSSDEPTSKDAANVIRVDASRSTVKCGPKTAQAAVKDGPTVKSFKKIINDQEPKKAEHNGPLVQDLFDTLNKKKDKALLAAAIVKPTVQKKVSRQSKRPALQAEKTKIRQSSAVKKQTKVVKIDKQSSDKSARPKSSKRPKGKKKKGKEIEDKDRITIISDKDNPSDFHFIGGDRWRIDKVYNDNNDVKALQLVRRSVDLKEEEDPNSPEVLPNYITYMDEVMSNKPSTAPSNRRYSTLLDDVNNDSASCSDSDSDSLEDSSNSDDSVFNIKGSAKIAPLVSTASITSDTKTTLPQSINEVSDTKAKNPDDIYLPRKGDETKGNTLTDNLTNKKSSAVIRPKIVKRASIEKRNSLEKSNSLEMSAGEKKDGSAKEKVTDPPVPPPRIKKKIKTILSSNGLETEEDLDDAIKELMKNTPNPSLSLTSSLGSRKSDTLRKSIDSVQRSMEARGRFERELLESQDGKSFKRINSLPRPKRESPLPPPFGFEDEDDKDDIELDALHQVGCHCRCVFF